MNTKLLESPEKHIPDGYYCYTNGTQTICPFWDTKPGQYPYREDGYCHYLNKSDWDLNEEASDNIVYVGGDTSSMTGIPVSSLSDEKEIDKTSGKVIHFISSLLWDQVKECGINMEECDDTEIVITDGSTGEIKYTTVGEIKKGKKDA